MIYIDGSFVKHSIPVKPIYITLQNLDSVVSGKAMAWRVLGMLPSFKKSATPNETDEWRRQRRLGMHYPALQWLPTKLAEWIANNMRDELGFPDKADPRRGWTSAELNSILQNHVVRNRPNLQ